MKTNAKTMTLRLDRELATDLAIVAEVDAQPIAEVVRQAVDSYLQGKNVFCPIVKTELNVQTCPAKSCIYKGIGGSCNHEVLTADEVSIQDIADARQEKAYKVKAQAATSKQMITTGLIINRYADYIKDSFPSREMLKVELQSVNRDEDSHLFRVLENLFGLSKYQQIFFWNEDRFEEWANRAKLTVSLAEVRQVMLSASSQS